jgi:hypothetical protein
LPKGDVTETRLGDRAWSERQRLREYSFGSYHSKTEVIGQSLHYTRAVEIKELSVPLSKMDDLKTFYRSIATDERNTAVLKPTVGGVEGM